MPAHIKAALTPVSLSVPVMEGRLALGTWQGLYLFEHRDAAASSRDRAAHFRLASCSTRPSRLATVPDS